MRFLLVDDHPIFLSGLRGLLTASGFEVIGVAHDGLEALAQVRTLKPDVVLMDISMSRCDGIAGTRLIKAEFPDVRVVILSVADDDDALFQAIRNGASGFLNKCQDSDEFLNCLRELARGEIALAPGFAQRVLNEFSRLVEPEDGQHDASERLSPRQAQVLALVTRGFTYKEAGYELGLTERTVKHYMGQILTLLHVKNRAEAVLYARTHGLT